MYVIKQIDIYLVCHRYGIKKVNHMENLLCKKQNKFKCMAVIWNEVSTIIFFYIWCLSAAVLIFQASNLSNRKLKKFKSFKLSSIQSPIASFEQEWN